jgi:small-conductance mechanosensitive channel
VTLLGLHISQTALVKGAIVIAIVAITLVSARVVGGLLRRWMAKTGAVPATSIFVNITRIAVVIIGAAFVLSVLGISITPVLTALGVGGLAVALALQDTLSNLFAGLQIVASKQIRPGDYVQVSPGQEGTVVDVAWRTTTLRTPLDNMVIVPNAVLAQAIVTNYQLPVAAVATSIEFGVGYDASLAQVEDVVTDVAAQVRREFGHDPEAHPPVVRFKSFGASEIVCAAIMSVGEYGDQFPLKSAFIKALHERFAAEGIAFPYPQRTVHMAER